MRAAIIFCLCVFFLVAKGSESAHALAPRISQGHKYLNEAPQAEQQHTPFHKKANVHIQKSVSSREVNYIEQCQDEDENTSKKALTIFKQTSYFCCVLLTDNLQTIKKLALPYCEHFSYTASFKYLLLRVFRI